MNATTCAIAALLRSELPELLAHRLRPPPHLHVLDAPGAQLAHRELASIPASSSSFRAVWTAGTDEAWPNRWATIRRQCQSLRE